MALLVRQRNPPADKKTIRNSPAGFRSDKRKSKSTAEHGKCQTTATETIHHLAWVSTAVILDGTAKPWVAKHHLPLFLRHFTARYGANGPKQVSPRKPWGRHDDLPGAAAELLE